MNKLRELRKSKGLTIRELAEETHISYPVISYMETEERPFTQQNLETLCKYFNVSTDYMLGHTTNPSPELVEQKNLTIQERYILDAIKGLSTEQYQEIIKYIELIKIRDMLKKGTAV